jgi:glucosamine--fructose-6-phosphate aminotransferase (isomerizing)
MSSQLQAMDESQPAALRAVSDYDVSAAARVLARARRVVLVGTGTSFHAAELGAYLFRTGGVSAEAVSSVELARWRPVLDGADAVIVISHTGTTPYALSVRAAAREAGSPLVTITGPQAEWEEAIKTPVRERSETYTVSYVCALGVLGLLGHALAGTDTGPGRVLAVADDIEAQIATSAIADVPVPDRALAIVGPGPWSVTAREGALKTREAAHILADGFDPERLLHGPAVPYGRGDTVIGLQPAADVDGLTGRLVEAAAAEGAATHILESDGAEAHPFTAQLVATTRLQLVAAHFADLRGTDPDHAITGAWSGDELWVAGAPSAAGSG